MKRRPTALRSYSGQLAYVLSSFIVILLVISGAFAVDTFHMVSAQRELQSAVDAGALAGALRLGKNGSEEAKAMALSITQRNYVEGEPVCNSSPNTNVSVSATSSSEYSPGKVTVTASREIDCIFAKIIGIWTCNVTATAEASGVSMLTRIPERMLFPLAVSIDAIPIEKNGQQGKPLSTYNVGEQVKLYLGATTGKNAAFTSFTTAPTSNSYVKAAIIECLSIETSKSNNVTVPSFVVGDKLNITNGEGAFEYMLKDPAYGALLNAPYQVFPVIEGEPTYNQNRALVGFVAIKITAISKEKGEPILTGVIIRPALRGSSGTPYEGSYKDVIGRISPFTVRLIR